jgi:hypothetical protein
MCISLPTQTRGVCAGFHLVIFYLGADCFVVHHRPTWNDLLQSMGRDCHCAERNGHVGVKERRSTVVVLR